MSTLSKREVRRKDLVYAELCYQVMGVLFTVWTELGFGHKEKVYQKAVEEALTESKLRFKRELPARIQFRGKAVGMYFFDFLIEDKIVLELKVRSYFSRKDISELYAYLKAKCFKLGIIPILRERA